MPTATGDCYRAALHEVHAGGGTLVHGYPTGLGGEVEGRRFGHAWVEREGLVVDRANGNDVTLPREAYYAFGRIRPEECSYYTQVEAARQALRTGHYGPWADADCAEAA